MGGQIEPFAARIGADDARAVIVKSPFDFERNMRVFVAGDVPLPSPQEAKLALDVLADYIRFLHRASQRRLARAFHQLHRHARRRGGARTSLPRARPARS